ncbi:hypothetical protein J6590_016627 [Homalodisca vitripennis]|nr:hypothetical protein J6590_016627 [Homalodisca vitripennis]
MSPFTFYGGLLIRAQRVHAARRPLRPAQPSPDRPFILCQNAYNQMTSNEISRSGLGWADQSVGVHLIVCILTEYKRPVRAGLGRSQWAGVHSIVCILMAEYKRPVRAGLGRSQWAGVHLIACISTSLKGPGRSQAGGLLARTGSLSGHPFKQQPRSTLLDLVIL